MDLVKTRKRMSRSSGSRSSGSISTSNKTKKNKIDSPFNKKLIDACFERNDKLAFKFLSIGADVNYLDKDTGYTPLLIACETNNIKLVRLLIKRGADVNLREFEDSPFPLDIAIGTVKRLLEKKHAMKSPEKPKRVNLPVVEIKPHFHTETDKNFTKLILRIKNKSNKHHESEIALQTILDIINMRKSGLYKKELDIDLNQLSPTGQTLLIEAISRKKIQIVRALIHAGVDVNLLDAKGFSPLIVAIDDSDLSIIKLLIQTPGANVNIRDGNGFTPLWSALVNLEIAIKNKDLANKNASLHLIDGLIAHGADPSLRFGTRLNFDPLNESCICGSADAVKILLSSSNINVNNKDGNGNTPLLSAIKATDQDNSRDMYEIVKSLIINGADINITDSDGNLPITAAYENGHCERIITLLDKNKTHRNMTPLIGPIEWHI